MQDSYFYYILSKCQNCDISRICSNYKNREVLLRRVENVLDFFPSALNTVELMDAIADIIIYSGNDLVDFCIPPKILKGDITIIYSRVKTAFNTIEQIRISKQKINYDQLFEILLDLCWLLDSFYIAKKKSNTDAVLIDNIMDVKEATIALLSELYDKANNSSCEIDYINGAIKAIEEYPSRPSRAKFKFSASLEYIQNGWSIEELRDQKNELQILSTKRWALYYALVVTCALALGIRRMVY